MRRRDGRGLDEDGTYPVQQGEDAIPSGFAGGTAPAVITHALKTLGQDMLEQAPQELLAGQSGVVLDALVVAVAEGDALRRGAFNLAFVQGRAIKIAGQIFQGGVAAAHGLEVDVPLHPPDFGGDLFEAFGLVLF